MCGIAGIYAPDGQRPPMAGELDRMIRVLHHRGPDGYGRWLDSSVGLAHARLSIIDLVSGDQPIRNEDGTVQVVFNGEIFNYVELRSDLEKRGHGFYTASDTEVIVHLYEEFGDGFVEHLNGQFAIALWDARRHRLVLARDRVGIRPLYFGWSGGRLLFASEVKAILAEGSLEARLDVRSLFETFSYWSPLEGRSAFVGVASLPPGHVMSVEDGVATTTRYWDWDWKLDPARGPRRLTPTVVDELSSLLQDAVRLQLRADVPVGAYLSGGLDSSAITGMAHRITRQPVRAFSLVFDDREFDEGDHQRAVSSALDVERTEHHCTLRDIADSFERAMWHIESPIVRTAPVPLMHLARRVREAGYKVVLTGEGADEVFAGYDIFREAKLRRWIARNPGSRWRGRLFERLYPYLAASPTQSASMAERHFAAGIGDARHPAYAHGPRIRATQRAFQLLSADLRRQAADFDAPAELARAFPIGSRSWPDLGRDQYVEAHTLMSGYLLSAQGDRVAMAHSIEGRVPFLDHRVIEFACSLPPSAHLSVLREKNLLKKAVSPFVPAPVLARTKQPFRAPDSRCFFEGGLPHALVDEMLEPGRVRQAGYFDPAAVAQLVAKCRAGRALGFADNMAFIGVLSTMTLHALMVEGKGGRPD